VITHTKFTLTRDNTSQITYSVGDLILEEDQDHWYVQHFVDIPDFIMPDIITDLSVKPKRRSKGA
jgi:hypothetical protein